MTMTNNSIEQFKLHIGKENYAPLIMRLKEVNSDILGKGIRSYNQDKGLACYNGKSDLLSGYSYPEFYDWDLYFENIYLSYYGIHKYCRNNVEAFLDTQLTNGFVSRTLISPRPRQHFKPFLAQITLLGCRQKGNFDWLKNTYYYRLQKYLEHWFWYCDYDKNGLCVWNSADHSGMDNQISRAKEIDTDTTEGVDLNTYLYRELLAMSEIAKELGHSDDAKKYTQHATELKDLINTLLWHEKDGFYYDRDERTGNIIPVKSVSAFLPLWANLVSQERADRLIKEHLLNKDEFWLPYPVPTYSKTERDFCSHRIIEADNCNWRGSTWIPTNYMIYHGLINYGYKDIAKELAYKTFEMVLTETDTREYYDSITGVGQGLNPFWGWSTLAYLMSLEYELNYDPTDLNLEKFLPLANTHLDLSFNS